MKISFSGISDSTGAPALGHVVLEEAKGMCNG